MAAVTLSEKVLAAKSIICDIEGTTTSISFVKDTLFPYALKNVEDYLKKNWNEDATKTVVAALREQAEEDKKAEVEGVVAIPAGDSEDIIADIVKNVQWQMSLDRKTGSLKTLQGLVWAKGYQDGTIKGHVYDDVQKSFEKWTEAGRKIYIYSSGSVDAQKLLFENSEQGNLLKYLAGHYDTKIGAKREKESYESILKNIEATSEDALFLTDVFAEAKAAKEAGLQVVLLDRPGNAQLTEEERKEFPVITTFSDLSFSETKEESNGSTLNGKRKIDETENENAAEDQAQEPPNKVVKVEEDKKEDSGVTQADEAAKTTTASAADTASKPAESVPDKKDEEMEVDGGEPNDKKSEEGEKDTKEADKMEEGSEKVKAEEKSKEKKEEEVDTKKEEINSNESKTKEVVANEPEVTAEAKKEPVAAMDVDEQDGGDIKKDEKDTKVTEEIAPATEDKSAADDSKKAEDDSKESENLKESDNNTDDAKDAKKAEAVDKDVDATKETKEVPETSSKTEKDSTDGKLTDGAEKSEAKETTDTSEVKPVEKKEEEKAALPEKSDEKVSVEVATGVETNSSAPVDEVATEVKVDEKADPVPAEATVPKTKEDQEEKPATNGDAAKPSSDKTEATSSTDGGEPETPAGATNGDKAEDKLMTTNGSSPAEEEKNGDSDKENDTKSTNCESEEASAVVEKTNGSAAAAEDSVQEAAIAAEIKPKKVVDVVAPVATPTPPIEAES